MAQGILDVTDTNFSTEVLGAQKPVFVDFWAPWCGPCRAIGPVIEELQKEYGDKIIFAKCNIDDSPTTPSKFGIRAVPTIILFKDGQVVAQLSGAHPKAKFVELIKKAE